jgi:glucose-6-phosphate 1-dehydrogenase
VTNSLVVLGIYGDLAGRYLLPAVARLHEAGRLADGVHVVGVGRRDGDDEGLREHVRTELRKHAGELANGTVDAVASGAHYVQGSATNPKVLQAAVDAADGPAVIYLALPNTVFGDVFRALAGVTLPRGSRLVVEKPFGHSLEDARHLNALVHEVVPEGSVFRVDHFLAKQTVLNILGVRFANRLFEPVWNAMHVEGVDISWDETLGLEGRAGYYDGAGALVDMVQNHLLQLMALLAMEPVPSMSEHDLRDRKVDLLRSVRTLSPEEVRGGTVRARYGAGRVDGRELPAYASSAGITPARETETYAEVTLYVDNWRWAGVPFRLRSGKALAENRAEVVVRFKPVPHQPFDPGSARPNVMRFSFKPDTVALGINVNGIGDPFALDATELTVGIPGQELPPYALLLLEVFEGDPTLSIRGDEAEECWRIVEPVLAGWRSGDVPLREYPAGSAGP